MTIEAPCGVSWSAMSEREATRRFCGACQKHVHDLSRMTESEARDLLASPTTEGHCVRYFADERGQLVFLPDVPVSRLTRARRAALAAVALAAPLSLTACMGAAPARAPFAERAPRSCDSPYARVAPAASAVPSPAASVVAPVTAPAPSAATAPVTAAR